jgi:hypothetical protein
MRSRIVSLLLSAVLIVLSMGDLTDAAPRSKRERAKSAQDEQVVLVMTGVIGPGSYQRFRRLISRSKPAYVVLDGPGGVLGEALRIGQEVRRRGLTTVVIPNAHCASACAVVFLSGGPNTWARAPRSACMPRRRWTGELRPRAPVSWRITSAASACRAGSCATCRPPAPSEIRWLSRSERRALGIKPFESVR